LGGSLGSGLSSGFNSMADAVNSPINFNE